MNIFFLTLPGKRWRKRSIWSLRAGWSACEFHFTSVLRSVPSACASILVLLRAACVCAELPSKLHCLPLFYASRANQEIQDHLEPLDGRYVNISIPLHSFHSDTRVLIQPPSPPPPPTLSLSHACTHIHTHTHTLTHSFPRATEVRLVQLAAVDHVDRRSA